MLEGISRRFGEVLANDDVSLRIRSGEIHALIGENGAGKSTLVGIVYGVLQPDRGRIVWEGRPVRPESPFAARRLGIGIVFQHFSLFDALTVAENIALGIGAGRSGQEAVQLPGSPEEGEHGRGRRDPTAGGSVRGLRLPPRLGSVAARLAAPFADPTGGLQERIARVSAAYGLAVDPDATVAELSAGERQRVEIVRALLESPRLLILDEPTSVLTPREADQLFALLRRLAAEGRSILYISHKLREIRALCERATVLRRGRVVARCDPRTTTVGELARLMLGEGIGQGGARTGQERPPGVPGGDPKAGARKAEARRGEPVLALRSLTCPPAALRGQALEDVNLELREGEIAGIGGIAGHGQGTLVAVLSGEHRDIRQGTVVLDGRDVTPLGPRERRRLGLAVVPEERIGHGSVGELSLVDNALLTTWDRPGLRRGGWLRRGRARRLAGEILERFSVAAPGAHVRAASLSGGNLQRFIVGRELLQQPRVLVVAQPTWGVDPGAAAAIREALLALAAAGTAVLVVSQDLDELLAITTRLAILARGRLSRFVATGEADPETLGALMEGGRHPGGGPGDGAPGGRGAAGDETHGSDADAGPA